MAGRRYLPCAALNPWVAGYEIIETEGATPPHLVLPGPEPVLGFQYRGRMLALAAGEPSLLEAAGITGIPDGPRRYQALPGTGTLLVRFHPWGASAFLPSPMHEISGASVGLVLLMPGSDVRETQERMSEARDDAQRIGIAERFLLAQLRDRTPDGVVRRAARILLSPAGPAAVEDMAKRLEVGERQLERKFREWIGVGPKRFARLARFRNALREWQSLPAGAPVALPAGYYDQAHFIKEFRAFAGCTPAAFRKGLPEGGG